MSDQILSKILETGFTIHQIRQRVRVLKSYLNTKLYGGTPQSDPEFNLFSNWLQSLGADFFAQFNQTNFQTTFDELEKKVTSLNSLVVYFAIEPSEQQLQSIGLWLRSNFGAQFVFESKYDPNLIAGCALVWKGVYKDFSLKARIAENHEQILNTIQESIK